MTLLEMSACYTDSAVAIRERMAQLKTAAGKAESEELARALRQRIAELAPLLREMRELAVLTARSYDRGYHKHERYTL